jgi:hypothetical protein
MDLLLPAAQIPGRISSPRRAVPDIAQVEYEIAIEPVTMRHNFPLKDII